MGIKKIRVKIIIALERMFVVSYGRETMGKLMTTAEAAQASGYTQNRISILARKGLAKKAIGDHPLYLVDIDDVLRHRIEQEGKRGRRPLRDPAPEYAERMEELRNEN